MLATEMITWDIPALYQRFEREIGAKYWRNRVAQCKAEIRGNDLLANYLLGENSIAFQLDRLAELNEQYGLAVPINLIENRAIYPAVTFARQIVSLIDALPPDDAERIRRRVHGAFRNPDDMRGLLLELSTATHFLRRGMKVSWPETSGTGTFDLLVEGIGRGGLEVECKSMSDDKGRKIHRREALEFAAIIKPSLDVISAALVTGLSIVVTLPERLPKARSNRVALADQVIAAVYAGARHGKTTCGATIRIREFDPAPCAAALQRGDRLAMRGLFDEISGTFNRESMLIGSAVGGAIMLTLQSAQDDGWEKATFDTLSDAAKQITGTRAGLLIAALEGIDASALRSIAEDDNSAPGARSKVQKGVSKFLESTKRDHVVGVGFVSRSGLLSNQSGTASSGGAAYYFPRKESPFWSDDFKGLYAWSDD
jgi:hypothetical protein